MSRSTDYFIAGYQTRVNLEDQGLLQEQWRQHQQLDASLISPGYPFDAVSVVSGYGVRTPLGSTSDDSGDSSNAPKSARKWQEGVIKTPSWPMSTTESDVISHCISKFSMYNYQLCAWTSLLTLPRRSTIPNILSGHYRRGYAKKANWATFYLPHLSLGTVEDPLALAISAFTALQMNKDRTATSLYLQTLGQLRKVLARKHVAAMSNSEFLRIWASTLLLTEYENQRANQESQYQHLAGATTLSEIAWSRFAPYLDPGKAAQQDQQRSAKIRPQEHSHMIQEVAAEPPSRVESELPRYLMALTQRLNHSKAIRESRDTHWPLLHTPADRQGLGALLDKSSACYRLIIPLLHEFYGYLAAKPPTSPAEHMRLVESYAPKVKVIRETVAEYRTILADLQGTDKEVYQSCAKSDFPFSPVLKFVNPLMCGPITAPHVFIMFLAPFISEEEHYECVRFISGVFAGFEDNPGLLIDAAYPDIHVAAFWRRGRERDYFRAEVDRRGGDFKVLLLKIWDTIDVMGHLHGSPLSTTVKLGISLKAYSEAQRAGLKLKNTRH